MQSQYYHRKALSKVDVIKLRNEVRKFENIERKIKNMGNNKN